MATINIYLVLMTAFTKRAVKHAAGKNVCWDVYFGMLTDKFGIQ